MNETYRITMDTERYCENNPESPVCHHMECLHGKNRIETDLVNVLGCIVYAVYSRDLIYVRSWMSSIQEYGKEQVASVETWARSTKHCGQDILELPVPGVNVVDITKMLKPLSKKSSVKVPIGELYGHSNGLMLRRYRDTFIIVDKIAGGGD